MTNHYQAEKSHTTSEKPAVSLISMAEFEALLGKRISTDVPVAKSANSHDSTTWLVLALMAASIGWKVWKDAQPQPKMVYDAADRLVVQKPVQPVSKAIKGLIGSEKLIGQSLQQRKSGTDVRPETSTVETRPGAGKL